MSKQFCKTASKCFIGSFFVLALSFIGNEVKAADFSNFTLPMTISGTVYTDFISGCANGFENDPCTIFNLIFFNSTTTQGADLSNRLVGEAPDPLYIGNGSESAGWAVELQGNAMQAYPCNADFTNCASPSGGGSVAVVNGSSSNKRVFEHVRSTRDIRSTTTEAIVYSSANYYFETATLGTSTLPTTTNFLSFLNVPELLETKVPFAYFFQAKDVISGAYASSSTTTIAAGTFGVYIHGGTTTVDLFSTSTIGVYLKPDMVNLFRGLELAVLYAGFIYTLYFMAKSQHLI